MPTSANVVLVGWCAAFLVVAWRVEGNKQWGWFERRWKLLPLALLWALSYAVGLLLWNSFVCPHP
ncbi:hypothetical protein HDF16_003078 [Granulicella aggregans]|uniref:Uncharacterized protein n=1 Tax=Granulicella aggregans TaxID=474949 RepID=A0A7W7ZEY6_9BACT|nr:hypothetical protein [Granulicella aggregans]